MRHNEKKLDRMSLAAHLDECRRHRAVALAKGRGWLRQCGDSGWWRAAISHGVRASVVQLETRGTWRSSYPGQRNLPVTPRRQAFWRLRERDTHTHSLSLPPPSPEPGCDAVPIAIHGKAVCFCCTTGCWGPSVQRHCSPKCRLEPQHPIVCTKPICPSPLLSPDLCLADTFDTVHQQCAFVVDVNHGDGKRCREKNSVLMVEAEAEGEGIWVGEAAPQQLNDSEAQKKQKTPWAKASLQATGLLTSGCSAGGWRAEYSKSSPLKRQARQGGFAMSGRCGRLAIAVVVLAAAIAAGPALLSHLGTLLRGDWSQETKGITEWPEARSVSTPPPPPPPPPCKQLQPRFRQQLQRAASLGEADELEKLLQTLPPSCATALEELDLINLALRGRFENMLVWPPTRPGTPAGSHEKAVAVVLSSPARPGIAAGGAVYYATQYRIVPVLAQLLENAPLGELRDALQQADYNGETALHVAARSAWDGMGCQQGA